MGRIPLDPEETLRLIEQYDRTPFQRALANHVAIQPSDEALQTFADKYPDRHAQAITMYSRLSGYADAPTINVSIQAKVQALGDAQLTLELAQVQRRMIELERRLLPALPSKCADSLTIDITAHDVTEGQPPDAQL